MPGEAVVPVEKTEEVSGRRGRRACGEDGLRALRRVWMVLRNLCGEAAGVVEEVHGAQLAITSWRW